MSTRDLIRAAAFESFDKGGFDKASVASICRRAGVSNGSFFHAFATKDALAADLYLSALTEYHQAISDEISENPDAEAGIAAIVTTHVDWVVKNRIKARFLFDQAKSDWLAIRRDEQISENERFAAIIERWREPFIVSGDLPRLPTIVFMAQLIGPAQVLCRAWLSGRSDTAPSVHCAALVGCAKNSLLTGLQHRAAAN